MEWWQLYLLTRCEDLKSVAFHFMLGIIIASLIGFVAVPFLVMEKVFNQKYFIWFQTVLAFLLFFSTAVYVLVPTQKDIAVIISAHWATHNEEMAKLPDNVLKTLNGVLEKAQEKLKP